jgi:hypothetical protein
MFSIRSGQILGRYVSMHRPRLTKLLLRNKRAEKLTKIKMKKRNALYIKMSFISTMQNINSQMINKFLTLGSQLLLQYM